ncbi:hypothetical protein [Paraglaciecola polaris]|uniref:Uncharacterized protein n=1 Tax=Paraglaciecola polaris LMG 21857 TaxID=1129793 RepID=K6ZLH7_9ALTE|nr:hypothetical protein [Paraglaciecola polaris]GAC31192.1 hypothetical protein GPLA_0273 [Paraglaciecola polaris LMG 21857]|tara:strand:+ start:2321 stop:2500 length:180 start_codon:yes stop_codon:yes gene_type:complete
MQNSAVQSFEQNQFVPIQLRVDVLKRLLAAHYVCAEELHCEGTQSKRIIMKLLLQAAAV